jgi:hypothetical protein
MSDQTDSVEYAPDEAKQAAEERVSEPTPAAESIQQPGITAAENAQIGDENLAPVHEVEVDVNKDSVPAQVAAPETKPVTEVYVHETSVKLDRVILDPSSPEAVQIPDAGRGDLSLPIHDLDRGSVEDFFKEHGGS